MFFSKYHGTGNDFILIDNRAGTVMLSQEEIAHLCHRRYGVGADGLMMLHDSGAYDFEMKYFNSDGREGSMCGNGGRCIAAFANALGIVTEDAVFSAIDGIHRAKIHRKNSATTDVEVSLTDVKKIQQGGDGEYILDTGSPHFVKFTNLLDAIDVFEEGKKIRHSKQFQPGGINVNFVQKEKTGLRVMTFERGVEDITLSCGTGVTASAVAACADAENGPFTWTVNTPGGNLSVRFIKRDKRFTDIWLKGPAVKVFEGTSLR